MGWNDDWRYDKTNEGNDVDMVIRMVGRISHFYSKKMFVVGHEGFRPENEWLE